MPVQNQAQMHIGNAQNWRRGAIAPAPLFKLAFKLFSRNHEAKVFCIREKVNNYFWLCESMGCSPHTRPAAERAKIQDYFVNFQERLRALLGESGLTQGDLAAKADLSDATISSYLSGRTFSPKVEDVARLAKALNANAAWLAFGEGQKYSMELKETPPPYLTEADRKIADGIRRIEKALEDLQAARKPLSFGRAAAVARGILEDELKPKPKVHQKKL
jgi:transcriptional regulator with XRE-family HTH domain